MSTFVTPIPIHLDKLASVLPPGSTIERAEFDPSKKCVNVYWFNIKLQTKYSWPFEFTTEQLEKGQMPDGVTTPEMRETESARRLEEQERIKAKAAEEAQEKLEQAKQRASELAAKAEAERKVLTGCDNSTKSPEVEKMAGKTHKQKTKRNSRHSTAGAAAVDGTGPERASGVLAESNG